MGFDFTPEQKAAVETTDESIVLSAGAGSGKTRVLVERYLHILKHRLARVDEILAITFTNKAAGEMKERIMHQVLKHAFAAATPEDKEFWRTIKEDLHQSQISTFHAFCGQVLRDNPLQAGVDPYFSVLEELDANQLLQECIEELLLTGLEENRPEMLALVREFGIFAINGILQNAYMNSRGHDLEAIATHTLAQLQEGAEKAQNLKEEICELAEELIGLNHSEKLAAGTKSKLDALEVCWPELSAAVPGIVSIRDANRTALMRLRDILKGNVAKAVSEQIKRIREIVDEELDQYLADIRAMELVQPLLTVLCSIDAKYRERKQRVNGLDFEDLQEMTIEVLRTNPDFCAYYQRKYHFIMVDEFQDTNPVQEELIRLLIGGTSDAAVNDTRLFIVGDPKQSIYRFRGADVTVFKKLQAEISRTGREIALDVNFRSREKIIDFVNHFFEKVFGTVDNPYDMEYQPLQWKRRGQATDVCVELLVLNQAELKEEEMEGRAVEAEQLAQRIQAMVGRGEHLVYESAPGGGERARAVRYGDICILFQALSNVQIYEEALQRNGVPYAVVNGRGFFERQEVQDVLNLLKIIDNCHREIEWVGVLRSPFASLSDEDLFWIASSGQKLSKALENPAAIQGLSSTARTRVGHFREIVARARENRERKAISSLITDLLFDTGYLQLLMAHPYAALLRANIEKLVAMARQYEEDKWSSLGGFIKYMQRLADEAAREGMAQIPGKSEFVKLMTVHQSKGLEFPVVMLPDCQRPLLNTSFAPTVFFDPALGIGMKVRDPLTPGSVKTSVYEQIMAEERRREMAERKRLFYVAATRARDYLFISGQAKEFLTGTIEDGRNWLDWLGQVFPLGAPDDLPEFLPYGNADQHTMRVRGRSDETYSREIGATREIIGVERWQEIYRSPNVNPITPRGKTGYYEFGVSSLMTYARCPRWYYHQYIQRMPDNLQSPLGASKLLAELADDEVLRAISTGTLIDEGAGESPWDMDTSWEGASPLRLDMEVSPESDSKSAPVAVVGRGEKGTLIHLICQKLQTIEELPELVQRSVAHLRFDLLAEQIEQLVAEVRPHAEAFLQREIALRQRFRLHAVDGSGEIPGKDLREFSFNLVLGKSLIRGTIDRVLITPEELLLIDYKSNRISAGEVARKAQQYLLQLQIYALALKELYGKEWVRGKLHFLFPDCYTEELEFGPADFLQIQERLAHLTGAIIEASRCQAAGQELAKAFPCISSDMGCAYHGLCPYRIMCESFGKRGSQ